MGLAHSPRIVTDGLVLALDAGNTKSYPGSGTNWGDISGKSNNGTLVNDVGYDSGNGGAGLGGEPENPWTLRTSGVGGIIFAFTFGNNTYVFGGASGRLNTSTDAITWTLRTSGFDTQNIRALIYTNNTYVAAGENGKLNTSTDAITWTLRTSVFNNFNSLIYENNIYVAGGESGRLATSTDTIVWTYRTSAFAFDNINTLTFGNNTYVVAGGNSGILNTSTDTITWELRTSGFGSSNAIYALTYANNTYVVAGNTGILNTSTDTITWELRTSGFDSFQINALTFANNTYLAGGNSGILNTSTDTIHWTRRTSSSSSNVYALTFANNTYLAGGSSGTLSTSLATAILGSGGGALSFDGVDDYVQVPSTSNVQFGAENFTIECWINSSSLSSQYYAIVGQRTGDTLSTIGWSLYIDTSKVGINFSNGSSSLINTNNTTLSIGTWYHIAAVRNGSNLIVYVNGVGSTATSVSGSVVLTGSVLTIGGGFGSSAIGAYNGYISNLRIYKGKGLTAEEVQQNFNALRGRFGI